MVNRLPASVISICSALLFTLLFYKQLIGLNLLLYEMVILVLLGSVKRDLLLSFFGKILGIGLITSAFAVVWFNSAFSKSVNFLFLFTLVGYLSSGWAGKSYVWYLVGFRRMVLAQLDFATGSFRQRSSIRSRKLVKWLVRFTFVMMFTVLFLWMYYWSSPWFQQSLDLLYDNINIYLQQVEWSMVMVFVWGLFVSNYILLAGSSRLRGSKEHLELKRNRRKESATFRNMDLKEEYKVGISLLVILNILLLLVNFLDIKNVWFGFVFEGQFLKELVHRGTYVLILSVMVSMVILLFLFRNNLNFYRNNALLKTLSYVWIAQNVLLLVSVGVRNFWYIHHYALAYKRIGVIIFLVLTAIALVVLFMKISKRKSAAYFFHTNGLSVLFILLMGCFFNWDRIIAQYNIEHHKTAFLHLDFMARLSEKALPELDLPLEEIEKIKAQQPEVYSSRSSRIGRVSYMEPEAFHDSIQSKKASFLEEFPKRHWLSWNYADHRAYSELEE